jgi:hypothetical protein
MHSSLKSRGGPIPGWLGCEKKSDDVRLGLSDPAGSDALFQAVTGVVVRLVLLSVDHLGSLGGLLKNDDELDVFRAY